jgi:hypothetical protein
MNRYSPPLAAFVFAIAAAAMFAQQPPQPPRPDPQVQQPEPEPLVEATRQETWTLGDQLWDFKDVASVYQPVKATLNPRTGAAEWLLEIVKELAAGEVGLHENTEGSPFKVVLLDADKVVLEVEPEVRLSSRLTGKAGDKVKMVVQLPSAELLSQARHVRIERRTKVGF